MRKKLKYSILVILGFVAIIIVQYLIAGTVIKRTPTESPRLIVANPLNLSQIQELSKFRSCQGHDFSGYNFEGIHESNRSMKHYIIPKEEYGSSTGKVEAYAPFDGEIIAYAVENRGAQIKIKADGSEWIFIFFHLDLVNDLAVGSKVNAGDLLGYANIPDRTNFDMGIQYGLDHTILSFITGKILMFGEPPFFDYYDTPFRYMSDAVFDEYESLGLTREDFVHSKEYRDSNPCDFGNEGKFRNEDYVRVTRDPKLPN